MRAFLFKHTRLFLLATYLVIGFLSASSSVQAIDNDDDTLRVCTISVSGTGYAISDANSKTAYYTRKDGNKFFYKVKACGLDTATVNNCTTLGNQKVTAAFGYIGWTANYPLTKNGSCYEGEVEWSDSFGTGSYDIKVDVELSEGGNGAACTSKMPLCRRVYGKLSTEHGVDETDQCDAALTKLKSCNAVDFKTTELVINEPVEFTVNIDPILAKSCMSYDLEGANIYVYDPDGKEVLKEHMSGSKSRPGSCNNGAQLGSCDLSFTPTKLAPCDGAGGYQIKIDGLDSGLFSGGPSCTLNFGVGTTDESCVAPDPADVDPEQKFQLCDQIKRETTQYERCVRCMSGIAMTDTTPVSQTPDTPQGIWTAVGCIKTDPQSIITTVIRIGLSIAGGVALLMILAASFNFSIAAGDAKKVNEAKEMISNAVIGLIFIIMSVTILQFIGVQLLHIPGFGE